MRSAVHCLVALVTVVLALPASAQQVSGEFARIVVLRPQRGEAAGFVAGYKRHLDWHRINKDPWTWYGWTFVMGRRVGQFMDGTFGHAVAEFDTAIKPAEDQADNAGNVAPHADFDSHGVYERLPEASHGAPLPDASPYMVLTTFVVLPGSEDGFESSMARSARASAQRVSLFRLRLGGETSEYLVVRAAGSIAKAAALQPIDVPGGTAQRGQSELLRFQPDLSYAPQASRAPEHRSGE